MNAAKFELKSLLVERRLLLFDDKNGKGVFFAVKFLTEAPPDGSRASRLVVSFDGDMQELHAGQALVRRANNKIWIEATGGHALIDAEIIPIL